jgi:hypothetical protein
VKKTTQAVLGFRTSLQTAGRKDLWGTPEAEAKDEGAT